MPRQIGSPQIRDAFVFLTQAETDGRAFTQEELAAASGWSAHTTRGNISKKLAPLLRKVGGGYRCVGVKSLSEETFCRLCSQNTALAADPHRPRLSPRVEGLVNKAREAALAAVQHYNNPTAMFRSGNYVVLMVIAFTSLFHAIFERDGVDYAVYDDKTGLHKTVGGEPMLWDVLKCAKEYEGKQSTPLIENLNLLVPIRHKIEHRFMPELDADICAHSQAMLMNFEHVLTKEFTTYYSLNASLAVALQFSSARSAPRVSALRRLQSAEYQNLKRFITDFEAALADEVLTDPAFAFRVWLIGKTANSARASDMCIEYVPLDQCPPDLLDQLEKCNVAIKKSVREARNVGHLLPKAVCARVSQALGRRFNVAAHTDAWRRHGVRPDGSASDKTKTDSRYCVWDEAFRSYVYTEEWVERLIEEERPTSPPDRGDNRRGYQMSLPS